MHATVVVSSHPRLDFKNARDAVHAFVAARLRATGFDRVLFCDAAAAAEGLINDASRWDEPVVWIDAMNPLVDVDLVRTMLERLHASDRSICVADGAIPGTQPEAVVRLGAGQTFAAARDLGGNADPVTVRWSTQARHNNQFNLYKYKRLKVFLHLTEALPGMASMGIDELCSELSRPELFEKILLYFTPGSPVHLDRCLHCDGALQPLPPAMSQPLIGYLPPTRAAYHECIRCGLILLSPCLPPESLSDLYDEFDKRDFVASVNNPHQPGMPRCDLSSLDGILPRQTRSLDLGGGLGHFSQFLRASHPEWEVTHSDFELKKNPHLEAEGIRTRSLNFLVDEIGTADYDLITAWEVIEHIPFHLFGQVMDRIHRALRPGGVFMFSTPDFDSPLCRAFDFYHVCLPFHYTVFGRRWLMRYFGGQDRWTILETRTESDFLEDAEMWFDYARRTCPTLQLRGTSEVLQALFSGADRGALKRKLLSQGVGTEVIFALRRREA